MKPLYWLLKPCGYNTPDCPQVLWNQWLHQGYLWGWYSYEFYSGHSRKPGGWF